MASQSSDCFDVPGERKKIERGKRTEAQFAA